MSVVLLDIADIEFYDYLERPGPDAVSSLDKPSLVARLRARVTAQVRRSLSFDLRRPSTLA
jgi:hypothetical protein